MFWIVVLLIVAILMGVLGGSWSMLVIMIFLGIILLFVAIIITMNESEKQEEESNERLERFNYLASHYEEDPFGTIRELKEMVKSNCNYVNNGVERYEFVLLGYIMHQQNMGFEFKQYLYTFGDTIRVERNDYYVTESSHYNFYLSPEEILDIEIRLKEKLGRY